MWLLLGCVFALYAIAFAWLWVLCRLAARAEAPSTRKPIATNLIPFHHTDVPACDDPSPHVSEHVPFLVMNERRQPRGLSRLTHLGH